MKITGRAYGPGRRRTATRDCCNEVEAARALDDALELGRSLGCVPRRVVVLAVEGVAFGMGQEMTPAVADATAEGGLREAVVFCGGSVSRPSSKG